MSQVGSVDIRLSEDVDVPAVAGWRRPVVLLPAGTARTLGARNLGCVLAHEIAHVQRADTPPSSHAPFVVAATVGAAVLLLVVQMSMSGLAASSWAVMERDITVRQTVTR